MPYRSTRRAMLSTLGVSTIGVLLAACAPAAPTAPARAPEPTAAAKPTTAPAAPAAPAAQPAAPAPTAAAAAAPTAAPATTGSAKPQWEITSKPITVTMWDSTEDTKQDLYNKTLIPEYQKLRPNVTIKYESQSTFEVLQKLLTATATGTAPDIFELNDTYLPTYFSKNLLDPLPPEAFGFKTLDEMLQAYIPGRLDVMTYQGKLYGVPDQMNAQSLFMNNRLFKEAGLDPAKDAPKTWADVLELNKKLVKKNGDQIVQKGYDLRITSASSLAGTFELLLDQGGGMPFKDGKAVFNDELGIKAMQTMKSLAFAPKVSKNTGASPYQDFADEQDAMTTMGPNGGTYAETINPKIKGQYTVAQMPQLNPAKPVTTLTSFDVFVNAKLDDEKKRVAWDFVAFALSKPALWFGKTGMLQPLKGWDNTPEAKSIPYLDVHIKDMSLAVPRARTENFNEYQAALARASQRVLFENADPKESLDQAAAEYDAATKS
jgi:multiple sugar transport system substrate-binding protein